MYANGNILSRFVLPLSKAALASIGLMFAVAYWNDYTNYKLYITDSSLYNFQMKLRSIMMGSDLPQANGGATENTVKSAAIIIANFTIHDSVSVPAEILRKGC